MEPMHLLAEHTTHTLLEGSTALSARPDAPVMPERRGRWAHLRRTRAAVTALRPVDGVPACGPLGGRTRLPVGG